VPAFGFPKNSKLLRAHRQTGAGRIAAEVDPGKYEDATRLQHRFEPIRRRGDRVL
jgi:hypothetical protein